VKRQRRAAQPFGTTVAGFPVGQLSLRNWDGMTRTPTQIVDAIVEENRKISTFWSKAHGWAPIEAAELMSKSRLDWQVELGQTLHIWIASPPPSSSNAHLILGWANLGALVEGTMKWLLSVYDDDYKADVDALKNKKGDVVSPDGQTLEPLRQFFRKRFWSDTDSWNDWVLKIQQRRNAIHAYQDRDLGNHAEFIDDVEKYSKFLSEIHSRVPYPDFT
jgi:hypothetical protein